MVSLTDDRDGDREDDPEPEESLEEEAYAEIDPEIAEQVAEADAEDPNDEVDVDDPAEEPDDDVGEAATGDRKTVGHVYCRALGAGAAISQDRMGSGVDDRSAVIDEYADLAKELDLDEYMDQWYRENLSGSSELGPGQGLVAMTSLFAVMVLVEDTEMLDGAIDSMSGATAEVEA
ncbi:hypothetical protein NP511_04835 [Natrinema thermotolerans]|uniref:Uncharacterized protein n=1 Tax=Natrinema thermotolerans TaxID=121872 RepID=A0AAF0T2C7_9EURY|nr:hypothetical protein [Natrinema thermotolerans]QCC57865.1 hypothetical protein DVR14_04125 [Natrinema thermotolerans]WMT08958.1 hypothetical protein NP511_04835 [Natrinema thermotolerans]